MLKEIPLYKMESLFVLRFTFYFSPFDGVYPTPIRGTGQAFHFLFTLISPAIVEHFSGSPPLLNLVFRFEKFFFPPHCKNRILFFLSWLINPHLHQYQQEAQAKFGLP